MTNVFKDYSRYYDLLYGDKVYDKEVEYIHQIIQSHNPGARTILDLGCGTGTHANLLAEKGYSVIGIDFSKDMVDIANKKKDKEYKKNAEKLKFINHDVRNLNLNMKFDAVISLFHVFSYLNTNNDLLQGIDTIDKHLNSLHGIAIFDFWYGPGVLTELPVIRKKRFENEEMIIDRTAVPDFDSTKNVVNVNYNLEIFDKKNNLNFITEEKHPMRYFFIPELQMFLNHVDKKDITFYQWLTFNSPELSSFAACTVFHR